MRCIIVVFATLLLSACTMEPLEGYCNWDIWTQEYRCMF